MAGSAILDQSGNRIIDQSANVIVEDHGFLAPDGDVAADGWTTDGGGTSNLWMSIDEATANDVDYVQSPPIASVSLTVRLFDGATEIAEWTHADPLPETFTTAAQTLTAPQLAAITDYNNLFVELDDSAGDVYRFALSNPAGTDAPVILKYRYKKLVP